MHLFSNEGFLETAAEAFLPGRRCHVEVRSLASHAVRVLVAGHHVVTELPFYDFTQPLEGAPTSSASLAWFPRVVTGTTQVALDLRSPSSAPFTDWGAFPVFDAFERSMEAAGARPADSRRQRRRLSQDVGALTFTFDDADAFNACISWKGAQYLASGYPNLFARNACVELFQRLRGRGLVVVNSLRANDRVIAAHLGGLCEGAFSWWVPAYDPELAKYSPGRLLLEDTLRASHALGHREFDFLLGNEPYKYQYATHVRTVGPVGVAPWTRQLSSAAHSLAHRALVANPRLGELAQQVRRRARNAWSRATTTTTST